MTCEKIINNRKKREERYKKLNETIQEKGRDIALDYYEMTYIQESPEWNPRTVWGKAITYGSIVIIAVQCTTDAEALDLIEDLRR